MIGLYSAIPAASSVAAGTLYYPTDDRYVYVSTGTVWDLIASIPVPGSLFQGSMLVTPCGDLSGWTYESGLTNAAQLTAKAAYSVMSPITTNSVPDYIDFLPPSPSIVTGSGGIWTITACFGYHYLGSSGGSNFPGAYIVLKDGGTNRFYFGVQLNNSTTQAGATACAFTGHNRNYYSNLFSGEWHFNYNEYNIFWVRLRFDGVNYISEWSWDTFYWHVSIAGGVNEFDLNGNEGDRGYSNPITPTTWCIGMQFIPDLNTIWDVLSISQNPTNG